MSAQTFRCYVVYTREHKWRNRDGKFNKSIRKRKSKYIWITANNRDSAIDLVTKAHVKPRENEEVEKIVATPWKEDRALRAMGAKELPLRFDKS